MENVLYNPAASVLFRKKASILMCLRKCVFWKMCLDDSQKHASTKNINDGYFVSKWNLRCMQVTQKF